MAIFRTLTPRSGTKLCLYEPIFHAYKEENYIDTISFLEKSFYSGKNGKLS